MWQSIKPSHRNLRVWQLGLLAVIFVLWHVITKPGLIPPIVFENDQQAAFFFGEPLKVFGRIWAWFFTQADIYQHLWVTLLETVLAFGIGTALGLGLGLWLALSPLAAAIADPYIKAANSMPRVILAPIFAVWFGLGIASKVALGVTLVFFIVFFNVYQGVKEVSPVVLANARMLGASHRQLLIVGGRAVGIGEVGDVYSRVGHRLGGVGGLGHRHRTLLRQGRAVGVEEDHPRLRRRRRRRRRLLQGHVLCRLTAGRHEKYESEQG